MVLTTITPAAAREPYNEAAAAPFNISIDSISSGFNAPKPRVPFCIPNVAEPVALFPPACPEIALRLALSMMIPSMITKGSEAPEIEFAPRILKRKPPPGAPSVLYASTPAKRPTRAFSTLAAGILSMVSEVRLEREVPNSFCLVFIDKPVTITSSKNLVPVSSSKFKD